MIYPLSAAFFNFKNSKNTVADFSQVLYCCTNVLVLYSYRLMCNNAADTPKLTPTSEKYPYLSQESYAQHVEVVASELLLSDERTTVDVREVVPLRDGRVILLDAGHQSVNELNLLAHQSGELYRSPDRAVRDDIRVFQTL